MNQAAGMRWARALWLVLVLAGLSVARAADLPEIKARGVLRHLGIPYANFVSKDGKGFDVELMRGFAAEICVNYELVLTDFVNVIPDLLGGEADVVMSDMAANTTGHKKTDHLRIIGLAELAVEFARQVLAPKGSFVAKVFQGGMETALLNDLKRDFATVRHVKPSASRADSSELYVLATGFRGRSLNDPVPEPVERQS
jgi:23S rRNA (uridine2552-2'-O)-methyltransferase